MNVQERSERRSIANPMFWVGLSCWFFGILVCCTIIGLPLGVAMVEGGKAWMYK